MSISGLSQQSPVAIPNSAATTKRTETQAANLQEGAVKEAATKNQAVALPAKTVDPSKKINADGTIGPRHKALHPKLPGSFHV